jgi:hypothetical protein
MDECGYACGLRCSQVNKHRTLKEVREYEASLEKQNAETTHSEKTIM